MNILLVEPEYKNKYPPLGLMKLSAYHKSKGDLVKFVKGLDKEAADLFWDRIYVTTLFTFDINIVVKTIRFYKCSVNNVRDIYVGGIAASLLSEDIAHATGVSNIIKGQLTDSSIIGYADHINIDEMTPDYDILYGVGYRYPTSDAYFIYATRGCPNKCQFCLVPTLEPEFKTINNIIDQIEEVDKKYGKKRTLVFLDNNVLFSPKFTSIIDSITEVGFTKGKNYLNETIFHKTLKYIEHGGFSEKDYVELVRYLEKISKCVRNEVKKREFDSVLQVLAHEDDKKAFILQNSDFISEIVTKYRSHSRMQRYVDFNQGLDAQLLTEEKMSLMSKVPIRPIRIAFDSIKEKGRYIKAVRLAHKYGIRQISNYMLYNFKDKPSDLWERLSINADLGEELGVHIFSFPMRYIPLDAKNRCYVGKYWNQKYLRSIPEIMHVTNGIVACQPKTFFEKAFGKNVEEYFEILSMPKDLIVYRYYYEGLNITQEWKNLFRTLTQSEIDQLLDYTGDGVFGVKNALDNGELSTKLKKILPYYLLDYKKEKRKTGMNSGKKMGL